MQKQTSYPSFKSFWNSTKLYLQKMVSHKSEMNDTKGALQEEKDQKDNANDTTNETLQLQIKGQGKQQLSQTKPQNGKVNQSFCQKLQRTSMINDSFDPPSITIKTCKRQSEYDISPQQSNSKIISSNKGPLRKLIKKNYNILEYSQNSQFLQTQGKKPALNSNHNHQRILIYDLPETGQFYLNYSRQFLLNLSYTEMTHVPQVEISNQYGTITFLEPVSLLRKDISDKVIIKSCFFDIIEPEWKNKCVRVFLKNFSRPMLFRDCKQTIERFAEELSTSKNMKILYFNKRQAILHMISADYAK